jgi:hypothetical protein
MNEHLVSTEADGYTFTFGISRSSLRIAGLCAVVAAAFLAVLINATEPFRVPLGIAMGVLVITLLITYAVNSSSRTHELQPETAKRARGPQMMVGKIMGKGSLGQSLPSLQNCMDGAHLLTKSSAPESGASSETVERRGTGSLGDTKPAPIRRHALSAWSHTSS